METVEVELEIDNDLIIHIHTLAQRYFGDDSDVSLSRVLELAFRMRRLFSDLVTNGQDEIEEPISKWEFTDSSLNVDSVQSWLFRK